MLLEEYVLNMQTVYKTYIYRLPVNGYGPCRLDLTKGGIPRDVGWAEGRKGGEP
jgi:hypothetical protein